MSAESAPDLARWLDGFLNEPSFLAKYPYYAAILGKMAPVADPSVQRMAVSLVSGRFYLHVNVESFIREPLYLRGVLLHEVHHVVLGHLTHPKFEDPSEPELMELALEMSANEYIDEKLPSPITWRAYASSGIRERQSTIERYEKLLAVMRTSGKRPRPDRAGEEAKVADDHRFLRQGDAIAGGLAQTAALVRSAIPKDGDQLVAGSSPGRLLEELSGTLRKPNDFVDWKTALAMFVARSRAPVHTYARPSRRFPGAIGRVPGRTYAPHAIARPHLLVAVDTSLSMTRRELEETARQLTQIQEHARVTIAECDVEIARLYPFEGAITNVMGRGGTDFRPIFTDALIGSVKPDGVVVFTDGDGPFPKDPPRLPTLWMLTKPEQFACPWGERAWLGRSPREKRPMAPPPRKRR